MLDFHSCDSFNPCLEKTQQNKTKQNNNNNNNNTKNRRKTKQINIK